MYQEIWAKRSNIIGGFGQERKNTQEKKSSCFCINVFIFNIFFGVLTCICSFMVD